MFIVIGVSPESLFGAERAQALGCTETVVKFAACTVVKAESADTEVVGVVIKRPGLELSVHSVGSQYTDLLGEALGTQKRLRKVLPASLSDVVKIRSVNLVEYYRTCNGSRWALVELDGRKVVIYWGRQLRFNRHTTGWKFEPAGAKAFVVREQSDEVSELPEVQVAATVDLKVATPPRPQAPVRRTSSLADRSWGHRAHRY